MTNKIVSIKTTNAIFLAIVLVTGTIAVLSSPSSFMTIGAAQAQQYYGKDNTFGDSEKEPPSVYDKNLQITKKLQELLEQYKKLVEPSIYDKNLQITQLTEELNFPTGIDFLGENDILVIEKNTGLVKRIVDGKVLNEPVLDVNVASESERGLLGIAILNTRSLTNADITTTTNNNNENSQKENNLNNEGEVKVFLFYTETKDIDNGEILGNRLYKYDFIDGKLVNPILLLDLPFLPGPSHNGGVLDIGPDNNLYLVIGDINLVIGDINREGNPTYMTLAQNIEASKIPDGRGGILRITPDGETVNDGFTLGDEGLLDKYYGYGIRNSFGISFDPMTGILWETENGSIFGDEINVILPGFNGGWRQILGLSTEYENFLFNKNLFDKNKEFDRNKLISFNGKGTYYDPIFMWVDTVAPTAITFINSKIFGEEYENDLLVGSVNQGGRIFHFNLNETRTGLDLPSAGELVDKMADVDEELKPVTLGGNFGMITDIEINPYDGKIYVVSGLDGQSKKGKIYQIYPTSQQQQKQKQLLTNEITTKDTAIKNIIQQKEEQQKQIVEEQKIIQNNNIILPSSLPKNIIPIQSHKK